MYTGPSMLRSNDLHDSTTCSMLQTYATILIFILAMLSNPDAQRNAQVELDSVLKDGTMPQFEDRESRLPYVTALVKEVFRWRGAAPLGLHISYVCFRRRPYIYKAWRILWRSKTSITDTVFLLDQSYFQISGKPNSIYSSGSDF